MLLIFRQTTVSKRPKQSSKTLPLIAVDINVKETINLKNKFVKVIKLLIILTILSNVTKGQTYTYDDIFKTNKIYFYGYDFTDFKVIEDKEIGNELTFIFGVIQFMNDNRKEKLFEKMLKKDTVIFDQNTVNDLNSKIPKYKLVLKRGMYKQSIERDINFGGRLDSVKVLEVNGNHSMLIRGYHSSKTFVSSESDSMDVEVSLRKQKYGDVEYKL